MTRVATVERIVRIVPWALRATWVGVVVAGGPAVDGALAEASASSRVVITWLAVAVWTLAALAMSIPGVATLTVTRVVVPLGPLAAGASAVGGADAIDALVFAVVTLIAAVLASTGELGRTFVQASAYGDEDRYLLRPPAAYLIVALTAWSIWAAVVMTTAAAIGHDRWVLATSCGLIAVVGAGLGAPRWHRLSRRWLVLVPAGMVLHDHLVLAETLMVRRQELAAVGLAPAGTDAADLTGPASGHAVEVRTRDAVTALLAASPAAPRAPALHLTGFIVAPTRPGRFLTAAAARRLPVGALA